MKKPVSKAFRHMVNLHDGALLPRSCIYSSAWSLISWIPKNVATRSRRASAMAMGLVSVSHVVQRT